LSSDGEIFATDAKVERREGGQAGECGIIIGSIKTDEYTTIHRFDNTDGAKSWRQSHPHPAFSSDGQRIYFNINEGGRTRLYVAELR